MGSTTQSDGGRIGMWIGTCRIKKREDVRLSHFFPLSNLVAYLGQLMLLGNNSLHCNNAFFTFSKSFHPFTPVDINDHIEF